MRSEKLKAVGIALKSWLVERRGGISGSKEEELFWLVDFALGESKSEMIVQQMRKNQSKKRT